MRSDGVSSRASSFLSFEFVRHKLKPPFQFRVGFLLRAALTAHSVMANVPPDDMAPMLAAAPVATA